MTQIKNKSDEKTELRKPKKARIFATLRGSNIIAWGADRIYLNVVPPKVTFPCWTPNVSEAALMPKEVAEHNVSQFDNLPPVEGFEIDWELVDS